MVHNIGETQMRVTSVTSTDAANTHTTDVGSPRVTNNPPPSVPIILPPDGAYNFWLVYVPRSPGPHQTTVEVQTNDPTRPKFTWTVTFHPTWWIDANSTVHRT